MVCIYVRRRTLAQIKHISYHRFDFHLGHGDSVGRSCSPLGADAIRAIATVEVTL